MPLRPDGALTGSPRLGRKLAGSQLRAIRLAQRCAPAMARPRRTAIVLTALALAALMAGCGSDEALPDRCEQDEPPGRLVLSLNGTWQVEQGQLGETAPAQFSHTVPVPALLTAADPPFAEVGQPSTQRDAFWYQTTFDAPQHGTVAVLNVHKAKYGIAVWLNGTLVGEHLGSYTLASFDVTSSLRRGGSNTLLIRVGAHLDSVPQSVPAGQDMEKSQWIPGIYDDVELVLSRTPRIVRTKVEPDIDGDSVRVVTTLANDHAEARTVTVETRVSAWAEQSAASDLHSATATVEPGQQVPVEQTIAIANPRLWSPEDPFLYVLHSTVRCQGNVQDTLETRFGMRKVEWRSATELEPAGFFLNNRRYFLRGSNITLHRFFEDPGVGTLPWDRDWVRQLLSTYPKQLHWNTFRICVGRAPKLWYDLADEVGLLLADEFMMWTLVDSRAQDWSLDEMAQEFAEWLQESWNHPSIAWWDGCNETGYAKCTDAIDRVRSLDETRQWESGGFNPPHGADDPIEDHPYLLSNLSTVENDLARMDGNDGQPPQGGIPGVRVLTFDDPSHPYIINEYGWLWIDRQGKPTSLTEEVYADLLGPGQHEPEVYREAYAYAVGGMTEFWRARRGYAGVLHFTYLGYSRPDGQTSDNFVDIDHLELEPRWLEYAKNAFAPLMVYIDTWQDDFAEGATVDIPVQVINDLDSSQSATLRLVVVGDNGGVLQQSPASAISLDGYGAAARALSLETLPAPPYMIFAELTPDDSSLPTVWSRRKVGFANIGQRGPDPPFP